MIYRQSSLCPSDKTGNRIITVVRATREKGLLLRNLVVARGNERDLMWLLRKLFVAKEIVARDNKRDN